LEFEPTHEDGGLCAYAAGLLHGDTGDGPQHFGSIAKLPSLHLFLHDDGIARGDLARVGRETIGRHDHWRQHAVRFGLGLRRHGYRERRQERKNKKKIDGSAS